MNERPWHRLHLATWITMILVGGALAECNLVPLIRGWPFAYAVPLYRYFDARCMAFNGIAFAAIVACTVFTVERFFRACGRQIPLGTLLVAIGVVGTMLAFWRFDHRQPFPELPLDWFPEDRIPAEVIFWRDDPGMVYIPLLHGTPWYSRLPIVFGMICVGFTVLWVAGCACRVADRKFRR